LLWVRTSSDPLRIRWSGDGAGCWAGDESDVLAWITSHSFRKTTATVLDDDGQTARQIADQLGHSKPSMTQDTDIGRTVQNPAQRLDCVLEDPDLEGPDIG
jgi:integrase